MIRIGEVFTWAEEDYKYGVGDLTIRVEALVGVLDLSDGRWLQVRGTRIWYGKALEQRSVLVRASAGQPSV